MNLKISLTKEQIEKVIALSISKQLDVPEETISGKVIAYSETIGTFPDSYNTTIIKGEFEVGLHPYPLQDFLNQITNYPQTRIPGVRIGQYAVNQLARLRPDLYQKITATEADCFYSDEKLDAFIAFVSENWDLKE